MTDISPMRNDTRGDLSGPPMHPKSKSSTLLDQKDKEGAAPPQSPQMMAIQGMGMLKQGARMMSMSLPALAMPLQQMVQQLESVVPKALADSIGGGQSMGVAGITPPPPTSQGSPGTGQPPVGQPS